MKELYYVSFYNTPNDDDWSFEVCAASDATEAETIVAKFMMKEHEMDIEENGIKEVYPLRCCNAYDIRVSPTTQDYRHSHPIT